MKIITNFALISLTLLSTFSEIQASKKNDIPIFNLAKNIYKPIPQRIHCFCDDTSISSISNIFYNTPTPNSDFSNKNCLFEEYIPTPITEDDCDFCGYIPTPITNQEYDFSSIAKVNSSEETISTDEEEINWLMSDEYDQAKQLIQREIGFLKDNIQLEINSLFKIPEYKKLSKKRRLLEIIAESKLTMICSNNDKYAPRIPKSESLTKLEKVKKKMNDFEYEISSYVKELIEYENILINNSNISNTIVCDYLSGKLNFLSTWQKDDNVVAIFFNNESLIENTYQVLKITVIDYITYRNKLDVNKNIDSIADGFFCSCLTVMKSIVDDVNENDYPDLKNKSHDIAMLAKYIWNTQNMKDLLDNVLQTKDQ